MKSILSRSIGLKTVFAATVFVFTVLALNVFVYAQPAGVGFWGGITEGIKLPKTTQEIIDEGSTVKTTSVVLPYKEVIFLTGTPTEFLGQITIKTSGEVKGDLGSFKATYTVARNASSPKEVTILRNIVYNVNYRREDKQYVYDYEVATWTETVTVGDKSFKLDSKMSHSSVSILEEKTAGVSYFRGDLSQKAVYIADSAVTTAESYGSIYGYNCAWSNSETHRIDVSLYNDEWQMQYQVRPSVSVNKVLQYTKNEPQAISFEGNYKEVMSNYSGLQYNISAFPSKLYNPVETIPLTGSAAINTFNSFEQLTAPELSALKSHPALADIEKIFAMKLLDNPTAFYKPEQAITRGQLVTMITKAIKLPIEKKTSSTSKTSSTLNIVFPDVLPDRPDYPYIMAAFKSGIAVGRGSGHFHADNTIMFEEAITIMIKALGLRNLGLNPTPITMFADDAKIADWAKRELYAAQRIGLIEPDQYGNINPKKVLTKAEGAALMNKFIDYMRSGIQLDYTEHIVNYTN